MKITKFKNDISSLSSESLVEKLDHLKRELFGLRLNATTSHLKDYSQFNKLRKNIARVITRLQEQKHSLNR